MPGADLVLRATAIHTGMAGNPAYPNPPVDMGVLETAIDSYVVSIGEALDGGKKAVIQRNQQREALSKMLQLLGLYVEIHCKDDMTTFLSSGFEAAFTTRTPSQPLPPARILRVDQGNTGQLLVNIKSLPGALSYEVRHVPLGTDTPGTWTTTTLTSAKKASPVNGLRPGMTYAFQVRALGKLGYTDWSDSATRMCT